MLYIKGTDVNETSSVAPSCPIWYYESRNTDFLKEINKDVRVVSSSYGLIPPVTTAQISSVALFSVLVHLCLVSAGIVLASLTDALVSVQLPLQLA